MSAAVRRRLLIAASPGELWAALSEGGTLVGLRLLRTGARSRVGEIYLGRIVALQPELPAALVDIGLPRPAFLSAEDAARKTGIAGLAEGQSVIVQVLKDARADKAAGVSLRPRLKGRLLELRPGRPGIVAKGLPAEERRRLIAALAAVAPAEDGLILRPETAGADAEALDVEAAALRSRWQAIIAASRSARPPARLTEPDPPIAALIAEFAAPPPEAIVIDDRAVFAEARSWFARRDPALAALLTLHRGPEPLFEQEDVAAQIEAALAPRVPLPGGGALIIESTAAATMIDVDSGGAPILATNLAAARVAARQIRLRNLAGAIVIDFIAMRRREDKDRVRAALSEALAGDPGAATALGWTRLGHMELVRSRRQAPLAELLYERGAEGGLVRTALTVALAALRAVAREADAVPGRALAVNGSPEVAATLTEGEAQDARRALEARLGRPLTIVAEPARARESFDIRAL